MNKRLGHYRLWNAVLVMVMLGQPLLPAIEAFGQTRGLEQAIVKANLFPGADAREARALAAGWAQYLEMFGSEAAEELEQHLTCEQAAIEAMQAQAARWAGMRNSLEPSGDALKLAQSLDGLTRLLAESLTGQKALLQDLRGLLRTIKTDVVSLNNGQAVVPEFFARIYEFETNARLLDSAQMLTVQLWNVLLLGQATLATQMDPGEREREACGAMEPSLADQLAKAQDSAARWIKVRQALTAATSQTRGSLDVDREATLLKATLKLADETAAGLRTKTDADSKAHLEMVNRYKAVIERRCERLAEIAQKPVEGLPQESFLRLPVSSRLAGGWAQYAARLEQISRGLVSDLAELDKAFQTTWQAADQCIAAAQKAITEVTRSTVPTSSAEPLGTLKKGLLAAQQELVSLTETLKETGEARRTLLGQVQGGGQAPFARPDLRSRAETAAYEQLGKTYELGQAVVVQVRSQVAAVLTLVEAAQLIGAATCSADLKDQIQALDRQLSAWEAPTSAKQARLEQFRELGIDVTSRYTQQVGWFAEQLRQELNAHPKGEYASILRQMLARLERDAKTIAGFSQPVLEAVQGPSPSIPIPPLSWIGTGSVGGALTRMIERGAYFEREGPVHVRSLLTQGDGKDLSDMLNITDLAVALDYPLRAFVSPDGMALVIGLDGPGVVIRGIGNVEYFKLHSDTPQVLRVPDFTLTGVAVGNNWWGGFRNWCNEVGKTVGGALNAAGPAVQGIQHFGAQVVGAVGGGLQWLGERAVEVGGFLWDSACTLWDEITHDPWKMVEYVGYGIALVGTGALTVATGGAAAPLLIGTAKYVGTHVAIDYGKAMVKTAKKRGSMDENLADGIVLAADIGTLVFDAKSMARGATSLPKTLRGSVSILKGTAPKWTVGLIKVYRDLAEAGAISWKSARLLQYAMTAWQSFSAIKSFWTFVNDLDAFLTEDASYTTALPAPTRPPSSGGSRVGPQGQTEPVQGGMGTR